MQLGVRVGLRRLPASIGPLQVLKARAAAPVQTGAQIDQPVRPFHERRKHVGRQHVHSPELRQPVQSLHPAWLAVTDPHIVDHCVEPPQRIRLFGH